MQKALSLLARSRFLFIQINNWSRKSMNQITLYRSHHQLSISMKLRGRWHLHFLTTFQLFRMKIHMYHNRYHWCHHSLKTSLIYRISLVDECFKSFVCLTFWYNRFQFSNHFHRLSFCERTFSIFFNTVRTHFENWWS